MRKTFLSKTHMLSAAAFMLLMASCACTREDESLPQQGTVSFPEIE